MRWFAAALLMSISLPARAEEPKAAQEGKPRLLVPDMVAERGVDESLVRLLNELLLTRIAETDRYEVFGGADIEKMLELEKQKDRLGCDTAECLSEIGGALGARYVAHSNIGRLGDYYLLNIKLFDVETAAVISRWSEQVEGMENQLAGALGRSVDNVMARATPGADNSEAASETESPTEAHLESGQPRSAFWSVAPWLTAGLAVAGGVAGGVLGKLAIDERALANSEQRGSPAWQTHDATNRDYALVADSALIGAGAMAAASLVLFLVAPDDEAAPAHAAVLPTAGGAMTFVQFQL